MTEPRFIEVTPFRVYKNSAGHVHRATKFGRESKHEPLRPILYLDHHNASLSNEEFEAVAAAANAAIDAVLLKKEPVVTA